MTNGTDTPVEDVNPIACLLRHGEPAAAGRLGILPGDQRMSRMEALRSYTLSNAYAAFEEESKGSLQAGKLADIMVLSKDILTIPEAEIPTAEVLYTIVGGQVMYRK